MEKTISIIKKLLDITLMFFLGVLTITVLLEVFSRYILNLSIPWSQDVIRISFIYLIFISVPILMRTNEHITIDFLQDSLPLAISKYTKIIAHCFIIFFMTILTLSGFIVTKNSIGQQLPYFDFSMSYVYIIIPFMSLITIIYTLFLMIKTIRS